MIFEFLWHWECRKTSIFVNICQKWEKCQKHAVLWSLFDDFLRGRKTLVFHEKLHSPFLKKVTFFRFSRYWELKTRKNPILQIARNVPRIRHLLERPRRTFLPHEGRQESQKTRFRTEITVFVISPEKDFSKKCFSPNTF